MDNPVFFEIPLDQGFCDVFTDARSGERTPTGAVRRGLRPIPHRSRGAAESEHGQCSRPSRTGRSGSSECDGNDESADVTGDRGGRRVRPGPRSPSGGRGKRRPAGVCGGDGATRHRRADRRGRPGPRGAFGQPVGNGAVVRSRRNWGHPNWTQRGRFPIGTRTEGSGNRVSVKRCRRVRDRATGIGSETRHRPPRHSAGRAM